MRTDGGRAGLAVSICGNKRREPGVMPEPCLVLLWPKLLGGTRLKALCNPAQQRLQFVGPNAVGGHKGANDRVRQHLLDR